MPKSNFKDKPFDERRKEFEKINSKYENLIPVIVTKDDKSDLQELDKTKFLVPADLTVGNFLAIIRKRVTLRPEQGLYLTIDNTMPPTQATMFVIYDEYKSEDGFLYVTYSGENTFGN